MKRTITRLFDNRTQAEAAVQQLEDLGLPHHDISIIAPKGPGAEDRSFSPNHETRHDVADSAGKGAVTGGVLGAGAGLLASLGLVAIPGIGPVLAAGWLAATAAGAAAGAAAGGATGGIIGALTDAGVDESDAHVYAEGMRRGGVLVSVRADADEAAQVELVLNRQNGVDAATRGQTYRQEGWSRFDPNTGDRGQAGGNDAPLGI